jgi:hypothetical protein
MPNGIVTEYTMERWGVNVTMPFLRPFIIKGVITIDFQIDKDYVAFLLLEAMYNDGKIGKKTFANILRMKQEYLAKIRTKTRERRGKTINE